MKQLLISSGIFTLVFAGVGWVLLFQTKSGDLTDKQEALLSQMGESAISNGEIPIAAILLYKDSIVAQSHNTVRTNKDLTQHAEINVVNQFFEQQGEAFFKINKADLTLITTFEPCQMCYGFLNQYGIQNVYFAKEKPLKNRIRRLWNQMMCRFRSYDIEEDGGQDRLFEVYNERQGQKDKQ